MSTFKPKLHVNRHLSSPDGKIYNAHYLGRNILLTPVLQQPSQYLTYVWRLTHQSHWDNSTCFNSAKEALADAISTIKGAN